MRGDRRDVHSVDFLQLRGRLHSRAAHPRQVRVPAEETLDRHPGCFAGRRGNRHLFLRLDRLVQPVLPFSAVHDPAGRLVDNHHLLVNDHVVAVFLVGQPGGQGLLDVPVDAFAVDRTDQRGLAGQDDSPAAGVGQVSGAAVRFVNEVDVGLQACRGAVAPAEQADAAGIVGLGHPDDQWRAGLVDQHTVGPVDQCEVVPTLGGGFGGSGTGLGLEQSVAIDRPAGDSLSQLVPEKVETHFLGGAIRHVTRVGRSPLIGFHRSLDAADRQSQ